MKKGFTIIEIVVAIGIFGITVVALVGFFAYSSKINNYSKNMTIATNLGQSVIDESFSQSYESLTVGSGSKVRFDPNQSDPYYNFEKKVDIFYVDQNLNQSVTDTGLKKIDCTIYWPQDTEEKNVQISTLKSSF